MSELTRSELQAMYADASPEYKTFFDNLVNSMSVLKNNKLEYQCRIFLNGSGVLTNDVQVNSLGQTVSWSRVSTGIYRMAVGGGFNYQKLNVQATLVYNSTAVRFELSDEDSPTFDFLCFNAAGSLVDGVILFVSLTYNP